MVDVLLRFASRQQAVQVGTALGFTKVDAESGDVSTTEATLDTAVCVIGEHFVPQPNDADGNPVPPVGDGKWWVMVRYMKELSDLPAGAWDAVQSFVVQPDDSDPAIPKQRWA